MKENVEQTLSDGIAYKILFENDTVYLQFFDTKNDIWQYKTAFTMEPKEMKDFEWVRKLCIFTINSKGEQLHSN